MDPCPGHPYTHLQRAACLTAHVPGLKQKPGSNPNSFRGTEVRTEGEDIHKPSPTNQSSSLGRSELLLCPYARQVTSSLT